MKVALASRTIDKFEVIVEKTNAGLYQCDANRVNSLVKLFAALDASTGTPEMVIYNPSARIYRPVQERFDMRSLLPAMARFWWHGEWPRE